MPSKTAIGGRIKEAMDAIASLSSSLGDTALVIPLRSRFGSEVLMAEQLEAIVAWMESIDIEQSIPQKYLEAEQLARDRAKKQDIVDKLLEDSDGDA